MRDALAVENIELAGLEGRRNLVFDHLDLGTVAHDHVARLELLAAADIQTDGGIELQRLAAGGGFGVAEHHADLFAQLVDEQADAVALGDEAVELAQRLGHQTRLQADVALAHVTVDFSLGHQRRDRVDDDDIHRAGAHQCVTDFQRLLAGVGLRDIELVDIHAQRLGIDGIQRVLRVDEGRRAAHLLRLRDHVQRHGGLTGGFRPVDLDDASARHAADAQRNIQLQAAGGNGLHIHGGLFAQLHDRALAELLFNRPQGIGERFFSFFFVGDLADLRVLGSRLCHGFSPPLSVVLFDFFDQHFQRARRGLATHLRPVAGEYVSFHALARFVCNAQIDQPHGHLDRAAARPGNSRD